MLPQPGNERSAAALRLVAAADAYAQNLELLVAGGYDPELYALLSRQFQQVLVCAHALPEVSLAWIAVLVSRAELTQCLWRLSRSSGPAPELAERYATHKAALAKMKKSAENSAGA
ncbi:MAG: hypothetical protein V4864_16240 [Pseudomonadota bacterium]